MANFFPDLIRVGNIGTIFNVQITQIINNIDVGVDLTNATSVSIDFQKPDNSIVNVAATIVPPSSSGFITYTDNVGIFNLVGRWQIRGNVNFLGGSVFHGSWISFSVGQ